MGDKFKKGIKKRITKAPNMARTPKSLSGIDRKIA
jgi:hypothetical protein